MDAPEIRFTRSGDVHLAYHQLGEGPPDLIYVAGSLSHLEVEWELPALRRFSEDVSQFARLTRFDKRGMGLSDRVQVGTLEERMDDVRAIMDATGIERAYVLGESEGGPLAMLFAAAHPERTAGLILCGAEVKEQITTDWPWGESSSESFEGAMATLANRWPTNGEIIDYIAPSLAGDAAARAWSIRLIRNAASPGSAEAFMRMAFDIDVRAVVPTICAPTLILHRVDDRVCNVENARFLAASIPGARYVELPGDDHVPWAGGPQVLEEIREFVTGIRESAIPDRVLATVLFTDIVDSTRRADELGDRRWRELVEEHHRIVRRELERFRGREIDTAGDGFLAAFDGPARALRAAQAIVDSVQPLGLELRAGVHTGECEALGEKLVGIAVHIGARVAGLAGPSQVLATSTVRDLVAGSGIQFSDHGVHHLKGITDSWQIYELVRT
ncbi:MAG: adenylate/guanylate cyclase domain-containing protein [Actinomycetes bacterium]